jgi:hypothetical protein
MLVGLDRVDEARPLLEQAAATARRELPEGSPERFRYEEMMELIGPPPGD